MAGSVAFDATIVEANRRRGRGARSNATGRYEASTRHVIDDGWGCLEDLPPFKTTVSVDTARTIITENQSPDISFDRSINPYRGCEHGCVYCYARPTHARMGLSPGLDFESTLFAKPNASELLIQELSKPGYQPKVIALGTNTDPYQPIERDWRVTRGVLEVLARTRHPVGIVTKSASIVRDLDILADLAKDGLVKVALSVTTLEGELARKMEPRASVPAKRLQAMTTLAEAGVPVSVMVAPIIPAINDMEIEAILAAAKAAGATEAGYVILRMPLEIKQLFREWLATEFPDRANRVVALLRQMRGGQDYDSRWFARQKGTGAYAAQIGARFELSLRRLGLNQRRLTVRSDLFRRPDKVGDQLSLL